MSLQTRLTDLITALGTDYKQVRTWLTGSSNGDLSGLSTTTKTSIVDAINEVDSRASGAPPQATETTAGIAEIATQTELVTGTDDTRIVTPLKLAQKLASFVPGNATETTAGVAELASASEVTTGTDDARIVTPFKLAQKLGEWAQPLSTNLTALSSQASTSYGRGLLNLANQAGLTAMIAAATESAAGIVERATQAETTTGTDDVRYVSPLKLQQKLSSWAVPLTYLDADSTLSANSDNKVATQKAVKAYADSILDANNAYVYRGSIDASANPNYPAANAGHTYKISVAGKIGGAAGPTVEPGDSLTCLADDSATGTHASVGTNWLIVQTNIDGAFIGPAASVTNNFVTFAGTTGKVGKDSGVGLDIDGAMTANSDQKIPSQKAVRTYVADATYAKSAIGNPETDLVAAYVAAKA